MKAISLIFSLCFSIVLFSQQPVQKENALHILGRSDGQQIKLRWAPSNYFTWQRCMESGVVLEKYVISKDKTVVPVSERAVPTFPNVEPIKPASDEATWTALAQKTDYAAVAAQAMFGTTFKVDNSTLNADNLSALINKAEEQQNRFSFALFAADQSFEVSQAMGLGFVDQAIQPGATYLYRVYPALPTNPPIDTAYIHIGTDDTYLLPKVMELKAEFRNQQALISWNTERTKAFYANYIIERSEDGLHFAPVNDLPFLNLKKHPERGVGYSIYLDSLDQNNRPYFYRIKGRTLFGEYGPVSDPVQGMGIDPLPDASPEISSILPAQEGGLMISWKIKEAAAGQIAGFKLLRGSTPTGIFAWISGPELIPSNQRFFIDSEPSTTNYYQLIAVDAYGRPLPSFKALAQLDDQIPPEPPVNIRGKIMNDGKMIITWDKNTEQDMLGYRVYMANNPNTEFAQLTSQVVSHNFYIDSVTLNTLSKKVYIKLRALDYRENPSAFSEIAIITRPDTLPPSAPVFKSVQASGSAVQLEWAFSSSPDVQKHELRRRPKGEDQWSVLASYDYLETQVYGHYEDQVAKKGQQYEYQLVATDDSDLQAFAQAVQSGIIDNGIRPRIFDPKIEADRRAKTIDLSWKYQPQSELRHFEIYRTDGTDMPQVYQIVKPEAAIIKIHKKKGITTYTFSDDQLQMNQRYSYQIRAVYERGAQSPLSDLISINY